METKNALFKETVYAATSWICYSFLSNLTSEDPLVGLNKPLALYERFIKWIMEFDLFKVNIFVLCLLIKQKHYAITVVDDTLITGKAPLD